MIDPIASPPHGLNERSVLVTDLVPDFLDHINDGMRAVYYEFRRPWTELSIQDSATFPLDQTQEDLILGVGQRHDDPVLRDLAAMAVHEEWADVE